MYVAEGFLVNKGVEIEEELGNKYEGENHHPRLYSGSEYACRQMFGYQGRIRRTTK